MHGSFGKYLDVDLTTGAITDYEIPEDWEQIGRASCRERG